MRRYCCPSISALALLLAGSLTSDPSAQSREGEWYSLQNASAPQLNAEIEKLVIEVLRRTNSPVSSSAIQQAVLYKHLAARTSKDLVFVSGTAKDVAQVVRDDSLGLLRSLRLEVINLRLGAAPFYLFTTAGKGRTLRQPGASVRVLYASRIGNLQPNDVEALLTRILGVKSTVSPPLNSPDELARRLFAENQSGGVDVVGIYDDDPSPFLHEFLTAYDASRTSQSAPGGSLQVLEMLLFPSGVADFETDRLQTVRANLTFAIVRFGDLALEEFNDVAPVRKDGLLAVSSTLGDAGPDSLWVLSNVRIAAGENEYQRVRRLLSNAYFPALFNSQDFVMRCEGGGARSGYAAYLLDAHLADRTNVARGLAVWSDLLLRGGTGTKQQLAQLNDQRLLVEAMLRQRLNVRVSDPSGVANRLSGPRGRVRFQFSGDHSELFKMAVAEYELARGSADAAVRTRLLNESRAKLLTLIEQFTGPGCRGKGLGLFGRGLDPYFQLSLVEAELAMGSPSRPTTIR